MVFIFISLSSLSTIIFIFIIASLGDIPDSHSETAKYNTIIGNKNYETDSDVENSEHDNIKSTGKLTYNKFSNPPPVSPLTPFQVPSLRVTTGEVISTSLSSMNSLLSPTSRTSPLSKIIPSISNRTLDDSEDRFPPPSPVSTAPSNSEDSYLKTPDSGLISTDNIHINENVNRMNSNRSSYNSDDEDSDIDSFHVNSNYDQNIHKINNYNDEIPDLPNNTNGHHSTPITNNAHENNGNITVESKNKDIVIDSKNNNVSTADNAGSKIQTNINSVPTPILNTPIAPKMNIDKSSIQNDDINTPTPKKKSFFGNLRKTILVTAGLKKTGSAKKGKGGESPQSSTASLPSKANTNAPPSPSKISVNSDNNDLKRGGRNVETREQKEERVLQTQWLRQQGSEKQRSPSLYSINSDSNDLKQEGIGAETREEKEERLLRKQWLQQQQQQGSRKQSDSQKSDFPPSKNDRFEDADDSFDNDSF